MKPHAQRGVALVITLVMLAVVTFMAITFLAVSRRERSSVSAAEEQATARFMADSALARAQAEIVARVLQQTNLFAGDLFVSTNFIERRGFDPNQPASLYNFTNVNYDQRLDGRPLSATDRLINIRNLRHDARAPVYVRTNLNDPAVPLDFRFFVDLNRNNRFETNGLLPALSYRRRPLNATNGIEIPPAPAGPILSNYFMGDPEWLGSLKNPEWPHSGSNRFVGRYAYLVLPAGKSLDLNFIGNHARLGLSDPTLLRNGFYRSQGVGSWELNLGAFFRDLNTNAWDEYDYEGLRQLPAGDGFEDTKLILRYRYNSNYASLAPAAYYFPPALRKLMEGDFVDSYSDGPAFASTNGFRTLQAENDLTDRPWAGADNPRDYFSLHELFDVTKVPRHLTNSLYQVAKTNFSTYDRYSFYRLLSQMGMDSLPAGTDKLNLGYRKWVGVTNVPPFFVTNLEPWQPLGLFTNVAERLLQTYRSTNRFLATNQGQRFTRDFIYVSDTMVRTNFSLTNILFSTYGATNTEYSPAIHRLLQLAANLCEAVANTNRVYGSSSNAYTLPLVFRPVYRCDGTNVFIQGWSEVTNAASAFLARQYCDVTSRDDLLALKGNPNLNIYGLPLIVGARKHQPNFNELFIRNVAQVTRKLEVTNSLARGWQTNLMYILTLSNQFGMEVWNSYTQAMVRPWRMQMRGEFTQMLVSSNQGMAQQPLFTNTLYFRTVPATTWQPRQYKVLPFEPQGTNVVLLTNAVYNPASARAFWTNETVFTPFPRDRYFYVPEWRLVLTNRFYYALVDNSEDRFVDYVSFANVKSELNLTRELAQSGQTQASGTTATETHNTWLTNRMNGTTNVHIPTLGVLNQIEISLGILQVGEQEWTSFSRVSPTGMDRPKSIDLFRRFLGLSPLVYTSPEQIALLDRELMGKRSFEAPYTPTRKLYQDLSWQVNDPLVHYHLGDLLDPYQRPDDPDRTNAVRFAVPPQILLTNSNLGFLNERYRPWGGNPNLSSDRLARDPRVKDPWVRGSDDWVFPTNLFPNVGWLGRMHRGTPWQTVYFKSDGVYATIGTNVMLRNALRPSDWFGWSGSLGTHPTNDWKLVDLFTAVPNDNAARGLLSVNQTNLAAWSAVFSGVSVLSNTVARLSAQTNVVELFVHPDAPDRNFGFGPNRVYPQLRQIVGGINRARSFEPYGTFASAGRILATPELSFASPYINTNYPMSDFVLERLPQQVLGLLKDDEPRFVIYVFGQTLKEAPNSVYLTPGPFYKLCTNYQVRAECAAKAVIRLEGPLEQPRIIVESFNELPRE